MSGKSLLSLCVAYALTTSCDGGAASCSEADAGSEGSCSTHSMHDKVVRQESVLLQMPLRLAQARVDARVVEEVTAQTLDDAEADVVGSGCSSGEVSRRRRARQMCSCRRRSSRAPADEGTGMRCEGFRMVRSVTQSGTGAVSRRRRVGSMTSCRRRQISAPEDVGTGWQCQGSTMVPEMEARVQNCSSSTSCLCVFDIDRTLTGKQAATDSCPRNRMLDMHDEAYGGGKATLSALSNEGLNTTFCNACYLGITSAGAGSGEHSDWNRFILDNIMRGEQQDNFTSHYPEVKTWSFRDDVKSPFVLSHRNTEKQDAVEAIRQWYSERGACVVPENVFFFGDRTENIEPFQMRGFNSREISCGSRDRRLHRNGMVGYCGATPEEIKRESGNILCA